MENQTFLTQLKAKYNFITFSLSSLQSSSIYNINKESSTLFPIFLSLMICSKKDNYNSGKSYKIWTAFSWF